MHLKGWAALTHEPTGRISTIFHVSSFSFLLSKKNLQLLLEIFWGEAPHPQYLSKCYRQYRQATRSRKRPGPTPLVARLFDWKFRWSRTFKVGFYHKCRVRAHRGTRTHEIHRGGPGPRRGLAGRLPLRSVREDCCWFRASGEVRTTTFIWTGLSTLVASLGHTARTIALGLR